MTSHLCFSVRFLQPYSHGRGDKGSPEWPPSPLRFFQALSAGAAGRWNEPEHLQRALPALRWLEAQPAPKIVAVVGRPAETKRQTYVPDNTADRLVSAWKNGDLTKQVSRTEKVVRPTHLSGDTVCYLYPLSDERCDHLELLTAAARSITHLGWGIDMVAGDANILSGAQSATLEGQRWLPAAVGGKPLRVPIEGTVTDLARKHEAFLNRLTLDSFRPVSPLQDFRIQGYRCESEPLQRPFRVFELRRTDGERFRYPHRKLIHIAGMVRHLTKAAMENHSPRDASQDWVERYVVGHAKPNETGHRQLSYLPLPSIGHIHTDPGVRRVMIAAPVGDDALLDHVARHLAGRMLEPERGDEFPDDDRPLLVPVRQDNITRYYTQPTSVWASVTPVILPGHDDHKPAKTHKLIEKALAQSGIEQPCEFEWSAFSRFPKSFSAHKCDKNGKPAGYFRPSHLLNQTAVHLTLRFKDVVQVPGPLVIGAGRHCGLGLMAAEQDWA